MPKERILYDSIGPNAAYEFTCGVCGFKGRTDNKRMLYCSEKCSRMAQSRRFYQRHAKRLRPAYREHKRKMRSIEKETRSGKD